MTNPFERKLGGEASEGADIEVLEAEPKIDEEALKADAERTKKEADVDSATKETGLKEARESINQIQEKPSEAEQEKERLIMLAKEKVEEMQKEIDGKKIGFLNKMLVSPQEVSVAERHIKEARESLSSGKLIDMESLKRHVKFAQKVDVSEFPKSKKKLVAPSGPGNMLAR